MGSWALRSPNMENFDPIIFMYNTPISVKLCKEINFIKKIPRVYISTHTIYSEYIYWTKIHLDITTFLYRFYIGIYAEGYIVFVFPIFRAFVRWYVHSFVHPSRSCNLRQSFPQICVKVSHEPLISKHSYLNHMYLGGSAFIPWLLTQGPCPRVGLEVNI